MAAPEGSEASPVGDGFDRGILPDAAWVELLEEYLDGHDLVDLRDAPEGWHSLGVVGAPPDLVRDRQGRGPSDYDS